MKKLMALMILAVLLSVHLSLGVSAERTVEDYFSEMEFPHPIEAFEETPCMAVYSVEDLSVLYQKEATAHIAPASLTKLVTASVVTMFLNPDDILTVGSELELVESDSSVCGLKRGMEVSVYDLLCGLLMRSGNDSAYTLAVNVARRVSGLELDDKEAIEWFCDMMNAFCDDIGADSSCFKTPDGYDAEGQYTTVSDLAVIAAYAMKNELISQITSMSRRSSPFESDIKEWYNTNFFMHEAFPLYDSAVFGMKTGSTDNAGKCLITLYKEGGQCYLAIVTGCRSEGQRYMSSAFLMMLRTLAENCLNITAGLKCCIY
ncbi:MAG: D-alanyl-D-alanine carboxypeptidase [Ruminococcaceae bacterium]|nr:D-alanyl-D-alanine carboxypeptidase [Oscillospiraceae bacterium]